MIKTLLEHANTKHSKEEYEAMTDERLLDEYHSMAWENGYDEGFKEAYG